MREGKENNEKLRAMQQENIPFSHSQSKIQIPASHIGQAILHLSYETMWSVIPQEIPVDKELL